MLPARSLQDEMLRSYIQTVFNRYDTDRNGSLDVMEMTGFFNDLFRTLQINVTVTPEQSLEAIKSIDQNSDGLVSKEELFLAFKKMLNPQQTPPPPPPQQPQNNWGYPPNNYGQNYNQGGYGSNSYGGYNAQGGYNPQQGGYNQNYPPQQGGYNQAYGYNQSYSSTQGYGGGSNPNMSNSTGYPANNYGTNPNMYQSQPNRFQGQPPNPNNPYR